MRLWPWSAEDDCCKAMTGGLRGTRDGESMGLDRKRSSGAAKRDPQALP